MREGNTKGIAIWNLVSRLEQRIVKILEKLGSDVGWVLATNPRILAELFVADRCKTMLELCYSEGCFRRLGP